MKFLKNNSVWSHTFIYRQLYWLDATFRSLLFYVWEREYATSFWLFLQTPSFLVIFTNAKFFCMLKSSFIPGKTTLLSDKEKNYTPDDVLVIH